jgi:hypothetical protein
LVSVLLHILLWPRERGSEVGPGAGARRRRRRRSRRSRRSRRRKRHGGANFGDDNGYGSQPALQLVRLGFSEGLRD